MVLVVLVVLFPRVAKRRAGAMISITTIGKTVEDGGWAMAIILRPLSWAKPNDSQAARKTNKRFKRL